MDYKILTHVVGPLRACEAAAQKITFLNNGPTKFGNGSFARKVVSATTDRVICVTRILLMGH